MKPTRASRAWHQLGVKETLAALGVNRSGLSVSQAAQHLATYGPNALPEAKRRSLGVVFIGQFASPLIYILFIEAAISFALGHRSDSATSSISASSTRSR